MTDRTTMMETINSMGFDQQFVNRAFKVYEKNYGSQYNIEVITEIIYRLQQKDAMKRNKKRDSLILDESKEEKEPNRRRRSSFDLLQERLEKLKANLDKRDSTISNDSNISFSAEDFSAYEKMKDSQPLNIKVVNPYSIGEWLEVQESESSNWITGTVSQKGDDWISVECDGLLTTQTIHIEKEKHRIRALGSGLKRQISQELMYELGFELEVIRRAKREYEKVYGTEYNKEILTEMILQLQFEEEEEREKLKKEKEKKEREERKEECVVCFDGPTDMVVIPCGHLCLCKECADRVKADTNKCPVCRKDVMEIYRCYRVNG